MIQTSVMKEFIGVTHTKFWWNEIASLATRYFTVNGQFYRNFSYVENFYLYFSVMLKSVFKLCFTRKTSVKRGFFFKVSKGLSFLLGGRTDILFGLFWDMRALSERSTFAALVNISQKLWQFKIYKQLKIKWYLKIALVV